MWCSTRLYTLPAHFSLVNDMPQAVDCDLVDCDLLLYADDSCLVFVDNDVNEIEK